jgi:hypothetical protein
MASHTADVNKLIAAIEEPSPTTWLEWEWSVSNAMKFSNVWYDILQKDANGNFPTAPVPANPLVPTAVETAAIRSFNDKATQAIRWLTTAAGRHNADIADNYAHTFDAGGLWNALEDRFFPKDVNQQLLVLKGLVAITKSQEESWETYFKKQDDAGKRFAQVFPASIPVATLKNLPFLMNTLSHLPASHPLRTNALSNPNPTSNSLRTTIRAHIATDGQEPPTETAALAGSVAGKAKCFFCGYNNHLIQTCNFVEFYQKLFSEHKRQGTGPFTGRGSRSTRGGHRGSTRGGRQGGPRNRANLVEEEEEMVDAPEYMETAGNASLSSPFTYLSSNRWIADTGASSSMTFHREWIHGMKPDRRAIKLADGNIIYSAGIGFALLVSCSKMSSIVFIIKNVLFVPNLRSNLLSVFTLTKKQGFTSTIDHEAIKFFKEGKLAFTGTLNDNQTATLNVITKEIPMPIIAYQVISEEAATIDRWHGRFCHRASDTIARAGRSNSVLGLKISPVTSGGRKCVPCVAGKLTRAPHTAVAERASEPLK